MRGRFGWASAGVVGLALIAPGLSSGADAEGDLDAVLARWERQSASARSIEAWFTVVQRVPTWDLPPATVKGWAKVVRPGKACVQLERTESAPDESPEGGARTFAERYVCTGAKVYEYDSANRQILVFPQDTHAPGESTAWGEAFQFLYDVKAEALRAKYRVKLVKETPKAYLIQVLRRDDAGPSPVTRADIVLDRATLFPESVRLFAPNGQDSHTFRFTKVKRDGPVNPSYFEVRLIRGWTVVDFTGTSRPRPEPGRPLPPPILSTPALR
jgi:TIGR03009 family protein